MTYIIPIMIKIAPPKIVEILPIDFLILLPKDKPIKVKEALQIAKTKAESK